MEFLEAAVATGTRIADGAEWSDSTCTWLRNSPKRDASRRSIGPDLYDGAAGVALYLGELFAQSGDEKFGRTASGAIRYATACSRRFSASRFGFYNGRVGIAYAAARLSNLLRMPECLDLAATSLHGLAGKEESDRHLCYLSGAAGAIPALLYLAKFLPGLGLSKMAERLGDHVVNRASLDPVGMSWSPSHAQIDRNLTGLAHGASGYGVALLDLYRYTGSTRYLYAAEQAFSYERHFYDAERQNWPDFRYDPGIIERVPGSNHTHDTKGVSPSQPAVMKFMTAWCHGAPGIGLARLIAYDVLKKEAYLTEAWQAIDHTVQSLQGPHDDYCLCHGKLGLSDFLLSAATVLNEPHLRSQSERVARRGIELAEEGSGPWPMRTTTSSDHTIGLMTGDAGAGYHLLRLSSAEVPSILALHVDHVDHVESPAPKRRRTQVTLQTDHLRKYFRRTLDVMNSLELHESAYRELMSPSRSDGNEFLDPRMFYENLCSYILTNEGRSISWLDDASRPERVRFEFSSAMYIKSAVNDLQLEHVDPDSTSQSDLSLSDDVRLVRCDYDWDKWLVLFENIDDDRTNITASDTFFLIRRYDSEAVEHKISVLAGIVLSLTKQNMAIPQIAAKIRGWMGTTAGSDQSEVIELVRKQLDECIRAGILVSASTG